MFRNSAFSLTCTCVLTFLVCSCAQAQENWGKCRVLALEGGGDKGSFEVGALSAFVDLLEPKEIEYDVITGVSVGAINAMGFALHKKGEEKQCVNWMKDLWLNMSASDIYTSWPFGLAQGVISKEGMYNNAHEVEFLGGIFDQFEAKQLQRKLAISTVDIDTGERVVFDENGAWDEFPKKVVASTSMPLAFTHLHMNNRTYIDGGSIWNLDISSGINRCLETHKEKDIIIDVILCSGLQPIQNQDKGTSKTSFNSNQKYNTVQNYMRYEDIKSYYGTMSDLVEIQRGFPKANFRYLVFPQEALPSGYIPLGFKHDDIVEMIEQGYKEAKNVILNKTENFFGKLNRFKDDLYNIYNPEQIQYFMSK